MRFELRKSWLPRASAATRGPTRGKTGLRAGATCGGVGDAASVRPGQPAWCRFYTPRQAGAELARGRLPADVAVVVDGATGGGGGARGFP